MLLKSAVVSILSMSFTAVAFAGAETSIDIRAKFGSEQIQYGSDAVSSTLSFDYLGGSGTAYANLQTGVLKDFAVAAPYPGGSDVSNTVAQSRIRDTLTFSAGATGIAYLEWSIHGSLPVFDNVLNSTADLFFFVNGVDNNVSENHVFTNFSCAPYNTTNCVAGTSVSRTGSVAFQINGNNPVDIQAGMQAYQRTVGPATFLTPPICI